MRRPKSRRGLSLSALGRGRAGHPPHSDVRPGSRRVAMEAAFPSLRASGGRPPPIQLFPPWEEGLVGAGPSPPPVIPQPLPTLGLNLPFCAAHDHVA